MTPMVAQTASVGKHALSHRLRLCFVREEEADPPLSKLDSECRSNIARCGGRSECPSLGPCGLALRTAAIGPFKSFRSLRVNDRVFQDQPLLDGRIARRVWLPMP